MVTSPGATATARTATAPSASTSRAPLTSRSTPAKAAKTHTLAGHPVVADGAGQDLTINVMHLFDQPGQWQVDVNNTTDHPITTTLRQAMPLPDLDFPDTPITVQPGEYRVLNW